MSETNNEFSVKYSDDMVEIVRVMTTRFNKEEAMKELVALDAQLLDSQSKELKMREALNNGEPEKQVEAMEKQVKEISSLKEQLDNVMKPIQKELDDKIRAEIKKLKIERGYERVKEKNAQIVLSNRIIADAIGDKDIDITHPMIRKMKQDFDKI